MTKIFYVLFIFFPRHILNEYSSHMEKHFHFLFPQSPNGLHEQNLKQHITKFGYAKDMETISSEFKLFASINSLSQEERWKLMSSAK